MKDEQTAYRELYSRLMRIHQAEQKDWLQFDTDWFIFRGIETRTPKDEYYWHGLNRGGDATHPHIIFQFTLDGIGEFESFGKTHRLEVGDAFLVVTPSDYKYYLPRGVNSWSFFWIAVHHPYIVSRFTQQIAQTGSVLNIPIDTRLFARTLEIWEQTHSSSARDSLTLEQLLFNWLFEFERHCHGLLHPHDERERWLQDVRQVVIDDLQSPCPVEKLAAKAGLSRTHYSHLFKSATGVSPAAWVQQVRLEEVARRLTNTDDKLEKIAGEAGYGDANHLCKVFRRYFHLSPNQFRRQMK
jgi:AraC-like DNA-binding protein